MNLQNLAEEGVYRDEALDLVREFNLFPRGGVSSKA